MSISPNLGAPAPVMVLPPGSFVVTPPTYTASALNALDTVGSEPAAATQDHRMLAGRYPTPNNTLSQTTALRALYAQQTDHDRAAAQQQQARDTGLAVAIGICALALLALGSYLILDARKRARAANPESPRALSAARFVK